MPYLETAQSWLTQSNLLLQAHPSTTRITSKYTIKNLKTSKPPKPRKQKPTEETSKPEITTQSTTQHEPARATLVLKTYEPKSGTTLKYSTTKGQEVSRLIQILGRLARPMSGLPELKDDVVMGTGGGEKADGGEGSGDGTPVVEKANLAGSAGGKGEQGKSGQQGGGQGGKGKKKKGKK